jgi:hypothetical protein
MRRLIRSTAALLLTALSLALPANPASAVTADRYGYWTKAPAGGGIGGVQLPIGAPADGLYIAQTTKADPSGPVAYSAVHVPVDKPADATFTIHAADANSGFANTTIVACPATTPWQSAKSGGSTDEGPKYDCAGVGGGVVGLASADGLQMTFALPSSFAVAGGFEIVLLPSGDTPFSVAAKPPAESDFSMSSADSAPPADVTSPAPSADVAPSPVDSPASSPPASSFGSSSAPALSSPTPSADLTTPSPLPDTPAAASSSATPAAAPSASGPAPSALAVPRPATPSPHRHRDRGQQLLALAVLAALGAGLAALATRPARGPRLLGSLGGSRAAAPSAVPAASAPRVGGIGRFARARTAQPSRL